MSSFLKVKQSGMSLVSMLVVAALLAGTGMVVAQAVPTVIEYQAVLKAVNRAKEGNTVQEVRSLFDKAASIDNISAISGKDIEVTKENDKVVVRFAYQREIHLTGPVYLTLKYAGQSR